MWQCDFSFSEDPPPQSSQQAQRSRQGPRFSPSCWQLLCFSVSRVVCLSMAAVLAVRPLVRSPAHPSVCEVVSLCGLELHFPNI